MGGYTLSAAPKSTRNSSFLFLVDCVLLTENVDENQGQDSRRKRRRILGPEFGSIDLESEEGKKLIAAKSQHVGAVREVSTQYDPDCRLRSSFGKTHQRSRVCCLPSG